MRTVNGASGRIFQRSGCSLLRARKELPSGVKVRALNQPNPLTLTRPLTLILTLTLTLIVTLTQTLLLTQDTSKRKRNIYVGRQSKKNEANIYSEREIKQRANDTHKRKPLRVEEKIPRAYRRVTVVPLDRVAIGYSPLEVMQQSVQQTNDERNKN